MKQIFLVEGHTDNVSTEASNMTLSERRAMSVGNELKRWPCSKTDLLLNGYGETQPKMDNATVESSEQEELVTGAANEK
jgi:OOP family OmpA-OmpF porin